MGLTSVPSWSDMVAFSPSPETNQREILSRTAVVSAARDLIAASGLDAFSLRNLARSLGVTATALYAYVSSKRDLMRAIAEDEFSMLMQRMALVAQDDPVARLRGYSRAYIDQAIERPELFRTMFLFPPDLSVVESSGHELPLATAAFELGVDAVREAIESGRFAPVDPTVAALTLWTATHGAATVLLLGYADDPALRELLVANVLDTVLKGLSTP